MTGKIKVKADMQGLCYAIEDSSGDHRYYLDLETGGVIFISEYYMDPMEKEELEEKVEEGFGERYVLIPRDDSSEGYEDMEDFIETVKDPHLKEKLSIAISGKGAFRRFKDVLLSYPEEGERWFKFKEGKLTGRIREWAEFEGIEMYKPDF